MSYKIVYDDIWNLSGITTQSNSQLRDKLKTLSSHFETFIGENRLQGEMVSSVKSYLQEVHGLLIESINLLLTEYETQLLLYKDGYFNIDSNNHSVLPEEVFETVKKELKQKQSEYSSNNDSLNSVSGEISDLVPFSVRKGDTINRYYTDISTNVEDLKSKVGNYESQHTNDLDSFKEHLSSFESLVNHYISQPHNIPTSYKSLDITKINEIKDFATSYQSLQNHLNASSVFLDAALKREEKRIEALKEEAIEARKQEAKSKYLTGALIAVGGLIAIVATAGAATPLVVGAGLVAGTGTVLYGASNMNEATNSYNLAMKGDITSKAFNPIRDTIFFGNQKAYDITGNIMIIGTMFTGGAAQVSKLVSLGNGALKSTATVATQFVGIAGASYVGGEVFKEGTYQLSKNVFELTDEESRRNSEIAKIVGNIVTGIVVAKPVINYTNNKFCINKKFIDLEPLEVQEIQPDVKVDDSFLKLNTNVKTIKLRDGIWSDGELNRGEEIDEILGNNVGKNYPVIDKFDYDEGIATSRKSRDLGAKSYLDGKTLERKIKKDIDKLDGFDGRTWGGTNISSNDIRKKELEIVVPNVKLNKLQVDAINRAIDYAREKGITINIVVGGN